MPLSDDIPSSPPGPSTSTADAIAYYKAQYESLEAELGEFQASSKELEAELEKDIEASEKREQQLKEKADNLAYEVDEWKTKYKQSKAEANAVQNTLQKEITTLRDANRTLQLRLRDTEVANDDYERQQRNTESSLEDLESKYTMAIERLVMMEKEVEVGEQERESLRIDTQRLRDELSDLRIEAEVLREKLKKAEANAGQRRKLPPLEPLLPSASPSSELSPTTTDSTPSCDTPPGKTVSSSAISDTHTPPSPPMSERSANATRPFKTASIPKTRMSITANNITPRPSKSGLKSLGHSRGPSVPATGGRSTPSTNFRQSISRPSVVPQRQAGLPQSKSIYHLHNLQGKMQQLTERVNTAKSKLPAPVDTPSKASPRTGPSLATTHIPSTVTVRGNRKRANGSTISGPSSLPDSTEQQNQESGPDSMVSPSTPSIRSKPSRQSLTMPPPAANLSRPTDKSALSYARPNSRASASTVSSRPSTNANHHPTPHAYQPSHSRPGSRASMSMSLSSTSKSLGTRASQHFTPNASTRVRPQSTLSNYGYDGAMDEEDGPNPQTGDADFTTSTFARGRMSTTSTKISDVRTVVGSAIPSASKGKRLSVSRLPAPTTNSAAAAASGRVSLGGMGTGHGVREYGGARPGSSDGGGDLRGLNEVHDDAASAAAADDDDETF